MRHRARLIRLRRGVVHPSAGAARRRTLGARGPVLVGTGGRAEGRLRPATRRTVGVLRAAHHRRGFADPHLLGRLHVPRPGAATFFRLPEPVRGGDAAAGPRRQLPRAVHGLGGRRFGVLPADRVLVLQAERGRRRQEGLRGQPGRRHGSGHRPDGAVRLGRFGRRSARCSPRCLP